jgi:hypothetical protein
VTAITHSAVASYTIPTDGPEADGTLEWTSTTIVVVELEGRRSVRSRVHVGAEGRRHGDR